MNTTEKLLRIPQPVEIATSFLYVSAAEICSCKKDEWPAFIRTLAEKEKPDFVFFEKTCCTEAVKDICQAVTASDAPTIFEKGNVRYAVLPSDVSDSACATVKSELVSSDKRIILLNGHGCESVKSLPVIACVYGNENQDYALFSDGVWYMNTAPSTEGGVRKVTLDVNGTLTSQLFYFTEKREIVFRNNWKTVLESRGTEGRPLRDKEFVYVPTADNGLPKRCGLYKLAGRDGGIVWKFPTQNSLNSDPADGGDTVMAVDCEATVYFICKEQGTLVEKISLPHIGRVADVKVVSYGNTAYVAVDGAIYAIDLNERRILWENKTDTSFKKPDICGKLLFCGNGEGVFALCRKTGQRVWANSAVKTRASALPLVNGRLFVAAGDTLYLLDGETGDILGGKRVADADFNVPSQPLLRGGVLYLGTAGKGVITLDVSDIIRAESPSPVNETAILDSYASEDGKNEVVSDIMYLDSHIVLTTSDGYMYMINIHTHEFKKKLCTLSSVKTSPVYVRMCKRGRTAMEAFIVTSSAGNKIFGNRL